jgi:hypothetical protein
VSQGYTPSFILYQEDAQAYDGGENGGIHILLPCAVVPLDQSEGDSAYQQCCDESLDILSRLKPRDSWVLTPPHSYHNGSLRLTRTPQRGNALPLNINSRMKVAVVMKPANGTRPRPVVQL